MGPHSFKCGKRILVVDKSNDVDGFNGAALFQVRKDEEYWKIAREILIGFNGAALFQVRKAS